MTNPGNLIAVGGGGYNRYLRVNVVNAAGGTVDIAGPTLQDSFVGPTTTTNNGFFVIEAGSTFSLSAGATFTQNAARAFQPTSDANTTNVGPPRTAGDA